MVMTLANLDHLLDPLLFAAAADPAGRQWIAELPQLTKTYSLRWSLVLDGQPTAGSHAVVIPVRQVNRRCVLKLEWPPDKASSEARALRKWNGHGAVQIFAADLGKGVLLLERLDPARSLTALPIIEAAEIAGSLLRKLSVPAPPGIPLLSDSLPRIRNSYADRQEKLDHPVPGEWLHKVHSLALDLERDVKARFLIHGDLHCDNVLMNARGQWVAIDPKPLAAIPNTRFRSYSGPARMRSKTLGASKSCLAIIVQSARLDHAKARTCALVRSVDYWLWSLEAGLTKDPPRCQRVVEALIA